MSSVTLPERIYGDWIWKKSLLDRTDTCLLMRKEFTCTFAGLDTNLWISANSSYQLFLNGRFIGFGPRAHQGGDISYIDQFDIGFYLESGINVLAVLVYYSIDADSEHRAPGLWCQMACSKGEVLASDASWLVYDGSCFTSNRPRISQGQGLTQVFHAERCPRRWTEPLFMPDTSWSHPDQIVSVDDFGTRLELHPLSPPEVDDDKLQFQFVEGGRIENWPNWSSVTFRHVSGRNRETYAAAGYIFCEEEQALPVKLYSDDPFKFYCNKQLVAAAAYRNGESGDVLRLRAGWNRLLLVQTPGRHAMGFMMVFPDNEAGNAVSVLQDMVESATPGWLTVGPLKLTLTEATSSLRFEHLKVKTFQTGDCEFPDPGSLMLEAELCPDAGCSPDKPLRQHEYRIFRLECMSYGFLRLRVDSAPGDIIDISVGLSRDRRGLVRAADGARGTGTLYGRGGRTTWLSCIPGDCVYAMIAVRQAAGEVKIDQLCFEELVRVEHHECTFKTSNDQLNHFWHIGRQTLRRSAAYVSPAEARPDYDCYLLDAYIDAVNMTAVYGDSEYITARLRQFLDAQLENGDIPALAYGTRRASQIPHLFFLPLWINYNYRYTANLVELKRSIPALDLVREYFEAMMDESTGLLIDVEHRFRVKSQISSAEFPEGEIPTYLNALLCRFLLSSAEAYRTAEQKGAAAHAVKLAQRVATSLRELCFNPKENLFARWRIASPTPPDCNLLANFCAIFSGVLTCEAFEHFFFSFFNFDPPFDRSDESQSPYFHFLFMEMMFAFGQREWGFRYFCDYWAKRLCADAGAWRETPESDMPAPTKFSNGSCVSPNIFLLREVLGIRIAEAGHSVIYFNPAYKEVEWAEGTIPMVRGRLRVRWANQPDGTFSVMLESNVPVKIMPEMSHAQLSRTEFQLSDNITLLNPPDELVEDDEEEDAGENQSE